jgi:hypothetical protein
MNKNNELEKIIQQKLNYIKDELETCILTGENDGVQKGNGLKAKESYIRSSKLINHIHELIKLGLILFDIDKEQIFPPVGEKTPEIQISGFLKQKNQDISVLPKNIKRERSRLTWGPMKYENIYDLYGFEYTSNCLVINVRSQISSLAKNADTLFERTFAEPLNLHLIYPELVLGEVYLIPLYEYDAESTKKNLIRFSTNQTNVKKYISFFSALNNRQSGNDFDQLYKYEAVALLIVDFSKDIPKIYNSTADLIADGIVEEDFPIELVNISLNSFFTSILNEYSKRHNINNIRR